MSQDLIPVFTADIGHSSVNAIDARILHEFLAVKSEFRNWIKNRITDYGFIQGIDYIAGNFLPGSDRIDYHCTISMGKELAMVERNAKGKEARQYFIECERRLMESRRIPDFASPAEAARAWALEYERAEAEKHKKLEAHRQIESMRPAQAFHNQIIGTEELWDLMYVFSVLQKKTGQQFTRKTWLAFLRRQGVACQPNPHSGIGINRFVPRKDYIGTWFVGEPTALGHMEWKIRPLAVANIVRLIEQEREMPQ